MKQVISEPEEQKHEGFFTQSENKEQKKTCKYHIAFELNYNI